MQIIPKTGLQGLVQNWQSDLIAAISVALVAMPLALGIAIASGAPPMAGIFSAIIGGVVTTFFRGSHVAINGPAAGLIAVILTSVAALDDGSGQAFNYVLAAIVVSGGIQVLLGLMKLGRYADIFHATVIRGILAAIGVIIIAKQIHIALGTQIKSDSVIESLTDVFKHLSDINPFVAIISVAGLLLLIYHSKISYKLFHFLPAPMWVLIISIPIVYAFDFFNAHEMSLFGNTYGVGPDLLVNIPDNIFESIAFPNFSKIETLPFWTSVLSITIIASIETLASTKAVDKLDPYKRRTDLDKDLLGVGISTMVSGMLGGLPIITVIVRSSVNVHNNAKTKWSNFYHGIILLLFVFLLAPVIQQVPLAALAIILVYTGFKLASPKVFRQVYDQGVEQLIFFLGTLIITLFTDLLFGIFGGLILALGTHLLLARVPVPTFFQMIFKPGSHLIKKKNGICELKIKGIANFLSAISIDKLLYEIPPNSKVNINLSEARLVDFSILENLHDFQRNHANTGGSVEISGLNKHISSSTHKLAMKLQISAPQKMSNRQIWLHEMAEEYGWDFHSEPSEHIDYLESFYFFKSRPLERKSNTISSTDGNVEWKIADVTFDEGAYMAMEEYKTTLGLVKFPFKIPKFTLEKKGFLAKYVDLSAHRDIDYVLYQNISKKFQLKVENEEQMTPFLNKELLNFIEESDIHHLESNGEAILIFNDHLRPARFLEYSKIIKVVEELRKLVKAPAN